MPSFYHATQALEKYLKALALSIRDPAGITETALNNHRWIREHRLHEWARRCETHFPFYAQPEIQARFKRFSEFDQAARYPWAQQKLGN